MKRGLEHARDLLAKSELDKALDTLKALADEHSDDPDIWLELSYTSRMCGSGDAAIYASRARDLAPADSRTYGELALALAQDLGRLDQATSVIERGLALDSAEALNWAILGTVRLADNNPAGASLACERALAIDPDCVEAHYVLGDAALAVDDLRKAEVHFRKVLSLAPDLAEAAAALEAIEDQAVANGQEVGVRHQPAVEVTGTSVKAAHFATPIADDIEGPRLVGPMTKPSADGRGGQARVAGGEHGPSADRAHYMSRSASDRHASGAADSVDDAGDALGTPSAREVLDARHDVPVGPDSVKTLNGEVLAAVYRHLDAYNARDLAALLHGFADDAVLRANGEVIVGHEELAAVFADAFESPDHTELILRSAIVQNETAACELTERQYLDDGEYASEFMGLYTVLDGRIVRARLYREDI